MAWLAVDSNGWEVILDSSSNMLPFRSNGFWRCDSLDDPIIYLPKGSIKKLTGKEITNPNIIIDLDDLEEIDMGDEEEPKECDFYDSTLCLDGVDDFIVGVDTSILKDYTSIQERQLLKNESTPTDKEEIKPVFEISAVDLAMDKYRCETIQRIIEYGFKEVEEEGNLYFSNGEIEITIDNTNYWCEKSPDDVLVLPFAASESTSKALFYLMMACDSWGLKEIRGVKCLVFSRKHSENCYVRRYGNKDIDK